MIMRFFDTRKGTAPRMICPKQAKCGCSSCYSEEFSQRVKTMLKECIADFEIRLSGDNKDSKKMHANIVKNLEKRLEELDAKEVKLWDKYTEEQMPKHIFDKLNAELLQDKEKVNVALCEAQKSAPSPVDYEKKLFMFRDALNALNDEEAPADKKNALLKACIERIEYSRKKPRKGESTEIELDFKLRV